MWDADDSDIFGRREGTDEELYQGETQDLYQDKNPYYDGDEYDYDGDEYEYSSTDTSKDWNKLLPPTTTHETANEPPLISPTIHFDGPFRFLELPQELRNMVYDHVWTATGSIRQRYKFGVYTITHGAPFWKPDQGESLIEDNGNAKWLLTNKQIMEEGLEQLRHGSAWHINGIEYNVPIAGRGAFDVDPTINTPHLLPSKVVHLDIKYALSFAWCVEKDTHIWTDWSNRVGSFFRFYPEAYSHTETFILQIGGKDKWEPVHWAVGPSCNHAGKVSFDLSLLQQQLASCSQLKKFCIQISSCNSRKVERNWPQVQLHLQGLADAASSVGRSLVEGGQETITDQDSYRGQLENAQGDRQVHWRYTIERP